MAVALGTISMSTSTKGCGTAGGMAPGAMRWPSLPCAKGSWRVKTCVLGCCVVRSFSTRSLWRTIPFRAWITLGGQHGHLHGHAGNGRATTPQTTPSAYDPVEVARQAAAPCYTPWPPSKTMRRKMQSWMRCLTSSPSTCAGGCASSASSKRLCQASICVTWGRRGRTAPRCCPAGLPRCRPLAGPHCRCPRAGRGETACL